ncbi:MAG: thiamine pyrophosphate-dependent dehydrogenase E1 component subunit alpha [Pseudomonadota bacterium]
MKTYSNTFLSRLLSTMLTIRICEEKLVDPILKGKIRCPVHLYTGEEAVATGVCGCLSREDYIFGTHRSHGHYIAKGGNINRLVAEFYGKAGGCSRGRGGSMHIIDTDNGILGATPIVAGTIPLALGASLASRIRKEKRVTVCFFGDGATGEGVLYESLNFASLHKLPIVFVCENNFYSTHMSIEECRPNNDIYRIAEPFDIRAIKVDGNDVLKVYESAEKAIDQCRNNEGPVFIECTTYRLRGHVGPDDNIQGTHTDIRSEIEIMEWREKDPITNFETYLANNNILTREQIGAIRLDVENNVKEAFRFAHECPYPNEVELNHYVFK